ncbi:GntR family transcriptional regulator [Botrimarina sp.]|uniref:GntR family transcriptional regulator n=1 Tax=Botrimarina sp. TaxID=2795802 RepID=UPI0032EBD474
MLLRIEKGSSVPISRQIAEQVASLCAAGKLKPGDRLPSVRELARELAVNQNTILRVYERLTGEGLLERRHGQGTFVAPHSGRRATAAHRRRLLEELRQIGRQGLGLGLSPDELHTLLGEALDQLGAESDAHAASTQRAASTQQPASTHQQGAKA